MKSGAINIDDYIGVQPEEQFEFIYTHYPIMKNLLTDYREDLIDEVIEQKSYNRRAANGDLGVRVQIVNDFMSCHQTAHTNCHQIA